MSFSSNGTTSLDKFKAKIKSMSQLSRLSRIFLRISTILQSFHINFLSYSNVFTYLPHLNLNDWLNVDNSADKPLPITSSQVLSLALSTHQVLKAANSINKNTRKNYRLHVIFRIFESADIFCKQRLDACRLCLRPYYVQISTLT